MDQRYGNQDGWINQLLKQMDLVPKRENDNNFEKFRAHLEESRLPERIGQIVSEINKAAGHRVLELNDYLPPQKKVMRVTFDKGRMQHTMEITLQDNGVTLMFYSLKKIPSAWESYFPRNPRSGNTAIILELVIQPAEIMEENIRMWLSYLISGLDKKFKPGIAAQAPKTSDALLDTIYRKMSA